MQLVRSAALALAFVLPLPAAAQAVVESSWTRPGRSALRADLEADNLAREALAAAERASSEKAEGLAYVAKALLACELQAEARSALEQALALAAEKDPADKDTFRTWVIGTYATAFGLEPARELLMTIEDGARFAEAAVQLAQYCLDRGDKEGAFALLQTADEPLLSQASTPVIARAAVQYAALGYAKDRALFEVDCLGLISMGLHSDLDPEALGIFVGEVLQRGDAVDAREKVRTWIEEYQSIGLNSRSLEPCLMPVIRAFVEQGDLGGARETIALLTLPNVRCEALGELAEAEHKAGEHEAARQHFREARGVGNQSALAALAVRLHRTGVDGVEEALEPSHIYRSVFDDGLVPGEAPALARAWVALGREEAHRTELEKWRIHSPGVALALALAYLERGEIAACVEALDAIIIWGEKDNAIRRIATRMQELERSVRERATLVAELAARARRLDGEVHCARSLAGLVLSGITFAQDPSALHPWQLPPPMEGRWRTPTQEEAESFGAHLLRLLEAASLPRPELRALRVRPLACYPEGWLVEFDGVHAGLPYLYNLVVAGTEAALLGGNGLVIHAFHERVPPLLETDEQVLDYVSYFTSAIADPLVRFRVVESRAALADLLAPGASLPEIALVPAAVESRTEQGISVRASVSVERALLDVRFLLQPGGRLDMVEERTLVRELPLDGEQWVAEVGGLRRAEPALQAALERAATAEGAFELGLAFASACGAGGWRCDDERAEAWIARAAELGRASAWHEVADAFARGRGVAVDVERAAEWLERSAARGYLDSFYELGTWYVGVASPGRRALGWQHLRRGVEREHPACLYELGRHTTYGHKDLPADVAQGKLLFERAAAAGHALAAAQLGLLAADAMGDERDLAQAARWFARGRELGGNEGRYFLAILRANDLCGAEYGEPLALYRELAEAGFAPAQVVLALRLRSGLGLPSGANRAEALSWSQRATESGHYYGGLLQVLLLAEQNDESAKTTARELRGRIATWQRPRASLQLAVDPAYRLGLEAPPEPTANAWLEAWHAWIQAEITRRLGA